MMNDVSPHVSVRPQKTVRDRTRLRLCVFLALVLALIGVAVFAEHFCPYPPDQQNLSMSLKSPSRAHPLGTDRYGRDMLSRVIAGAKTSVLATLALVAIISAVGTVTGVICGYLGGTVDSLLMRVSDVCLAFPGLVFALAIAAVFRGGVGNAVLALAAISWPKYSRVARSQTLVVKNTEYVAAARMAGSGTATIIFSHVLPNIAGPLLVTAMLDIGTMMMELAGLSFLGLGAQPPTPEWGSMMSTGRSMLQTYPWVVLSPGATIFVTVVLFNLLGDAVRDAMDPRQRRSR